MGALGAREICTCATRVHYMHRQSHTQTRTHTRACTDAHKHACMHMCAHTRLYIHTQENISNKLHTHTHTHLTLGEEKDVCTDACMHTLFPRINRGRKKQPVASYFPCTVWLL